MTTLITLIYIIAVIIGLFEFIAIIFLLVRTSNNRIRIENLEKNFYSSSPPGSQAPFQQESNESPIGQTGVRFIGDIQKGTTD